VFTVCVFIVRVFRVCVSTILIFRPPNYHHDRETGKHTVFGVISVFFRGVNELFVLLGCYAT
jgi:hypothetical protein